MVLSVNTHKNCPKVIDVSEYQDIQNLDFIAENGIRAIIFRCFKRGLIQDKIWLKWARKAKDAGIPVHVYWYVYAKNLSELRTEVETAIYCAKDCGAEYIFMDIEGTFAKRDISFIRQCVEEAESKVTECGYKFGVYCNFSLYKEKISAIYRGPVWLARYTKAEFEVYGNIIAWQFTSTYNVKGTNFHADMSYWLADIQEVAPSKKERVLKLTIPIMKGSDVEELQHNLNRAINAQIAEDGKFGADTALAVRAYQILRKLKVDEKAGPETQKSLAKE